MKEDNNEQVLVLGDEKLVLNHEKLVEQKLVMQRCQGSANAGTGMCRKQTGQDSQTP